MFYFQQEVAHGRQRITKGRVSSFSTSGETDFDRAAANVSRMRTPRDEGAAASLQLLQTGYVVTLHRRIRCRLGLRGRSHQARELDAAQGYGASARQGQRGHRGRDAWHDERQRRRDQPSSSSRSSRCCAADARAVGGGSPIAYTAQGAAEREASEVHAVSASRQSTSASARAEAGSSSSSAVEAALRARIVELEEEVRRLSRPPTKGWLNKYQPQAASWLGSSMGSANSKWEGRFFVLGVDGSGKAELRSYRAEGDAQPTRRIPLANCVVVDEGVKRTRLRGAYRIFSLWALGTLESERGPSSGSLLRVSCNSPQEVAEWFEALVAATGHPVQSAVGSPTSSPAIPVRRAANEGGTTREGAVGRSTVGEHQWCQRVRQHELPAVGRHGRDGGGVGGGDGPRLRRAKAAPPRRRGGSGGLTIVPPSQYGAAGGGGGGGAEEGSSTPSAPKSSGRRHRKPIDPNLFTASRPMHRAAKASLLSGLGTRASGGGEGGGWERPRRGRRRQARQHVGVHQPCLPPLCPRQWGGRPRECRVARPVDPAPPKPDEITSQLIGAAAEAADGSVAALLRDLVVGVLETALVLCLPVLAAYLIERAAVRGSLDRSTSDAWG